MKKILFFGVLFLIIFYGIISNYKKKVQKNYLMNTSYVSEKIIKNFRMQSFYFS